MRSTVFAMALAACWLLPAVATAQEGALVQGAVTDATSRRRVVGVTVSFGEGLTAVTDGRGRFEIKNLPTGTYHVRLSRIGYRLKTFDLPLGERDAKDAIFLDVSLEPLPVELEPLEVRGDTSTIVAYGRLADFYRRRRMGMGGRFFARQDIDRRNPLYVSDLLRTVPGAWFTYDRWGDQYISFRSFGRGRCSATLWLDGVRVPQGFGGVDAWVLPHDVEGIEVYNSDLTTPAELWGSFGGGCGTIAIWTR